MVREAWVKPMTLVQKFEANEAIAAEPCWDVICKSNGYHKWPDGTVKTNNANHPEKWGSYEEFLGTPGTTNDSGHYNCDDAGHNQFSFDINSGTVTFLGENGGSSDGVVTGVYDNGDGVLGLGDEVYWVTQGYNGLAVRVLTWTHWGVITKTANRS